MTSLLREIEKALDTLSPDKLEEVARDAQRATADFQRWVPNPGPQTLALESEADELFYGGQAGGGKSDLLLGTALSRHRRSLILRRLNAEVDGLIDRMVEIVGHTKGLKRNPPANWRFPSQVILFGGCQYLEDRKKYQGQPKDLICVGIGTPVMMGDGSHKAVERVIPGDMVMTLEGPRRVMRAFQTPRQPSVEITVKTREGSVIRQVQSASHRVLTSLGWLSSESLQTWNQAEVLFSEEANQSRASSRAHEETSRRFLSGSPPQLLARMLEQNNAALQGFDRVVRWLKGQLGSLSDMARAIPGIGFGWFEGGIRFFSQQQKYSPLPGVFLSPFPQSKIHPSPDSSWPCDGAYGRKMSSPPDFPEHCWFSPHPDDERPPAHSGLSTAARGGPPVPLLSADVAQPTPSDWQGDDGAQIPTRSHQSGCMYPHPYTSETRCSLRTLVPCACEISPIEDRVLFDLEVEEVNHFITHGGIVNKNCFDELPNFLEAQYTFIIAWARTTFPNQRVRVIGAGNPPTTPEGMWVIRRWAPWLDKNHPNPALPGELRWFTTIDGQDVEVDGPGPVVIDGAPLLDNKGNPILPKSRTFIPAELDDNPDLAETGYAATLAGLPAELRAAMHGGDFSTSQLTDAFQLIPGEWIDLAFARWDESGRNTPMNVLSVDIAEGGVDNTVFQPRHGSWYDRQSVYPGKMTPDGSTTASLAIKHSRNGCEIIIDMGGGWGGSTRDHLKQFTTPTLYNGAEVEAAKGMRDRTGTLKFYNVRAAAHWSLREALDPEYGSHIAIFPDPELKADLVSIRWKLTARGIQIEEKSEIKSRIGRSPDRSDALVMAHYAKGKTNGERIGIANLQRAATTSSKKPGWRR